MKYGLAGRVVTMDDTRSVVDDGVVWVDGTTIAAITPRAAPAPAGFEQVPPIETAGSIYPGLMELHNHLAYDILPLWQVPHPYPDRDAWGGSSNKQYGPMISGPMKILGGMPAYAAAIARYVEAKCLLGGTTTSQGLALFSTPGNQRYYRGVVRNVEAPNDPTLPAAASKISDVEAADAAEFLARLERQKLILHLAEGIDDAAHDHFLALQVDANTWAITENLIGIHCVALTSADFATMAQHGASMVWSPLSNLLLYGQTADVVAAKDAGLLIGLGADWSPTGSRNLLGELKAAKAHSDVLGGAFSDEELVAMATVNPARMLGWSRLLGSLEPGKYADVVVFAGMSGDPYATLLTAQETALSLVVIGGTPRYGNPPLMRSLGVQGEAVRFTAGRRIVNLADDEADPLVRGLSLAAAKSRLAAGLAQLPHPTPMMSRNGGERLLLDFEDRSHDVRPRLPFHGVPTGPAIAAASPPLPVGPIRLDGLTADRRLWSGMRREANLPAPFRDRLLTLAG